jgi:murein DD-endopeptidase MepM/ murein hydrolase activator NlpD
MLIMIPSAFAGQNHELPPDTIKSAALQPVHFEDEAEGDSIEDEDSEEIDSLVSSFWITDQVFAYRSLTDIMDSVLLNLSDTNRIFVLPVLGKKWHGFGPRKRRMHKGIDIGLQTGDPVRAAFDGVVRYAKKNRRGFGNLVVLRHFNGLETYYAHLSKLNVQPGDQVVAGDVIGLGGSTGRSRGAHLHFEIRFCDRPFDPEKVIDFENATLKINELWISKNLFLSSSRANNLASGPDLHIIKKGDTLGRIAARHGTTIAALCKANKITKKTILRPGRTLKIQ